MTIKWYNYCFFKREYIRDRNTFRRETILNCNHVKNIFYRKKKIVKNLKNIINEIFQSTSLNNKRKKKCLEYKNLFFLRKLKIILDYVFSRLTINLHFYEFEKFCIATIYDDFQLKYRDKNDLSWSISYNWKIIIWISRNNHFDVFWTQNDNYWVYDDIVNEKIFKRISKFVLIIKKNAFQIVIYKRENII